MKTMCKRTITFLLCALLLCGALPFAASAADVLSGTCGVDGGNVTWTLDTFTGLLTVSGTGAFGFEGVGTVQWDNHRELIRSAVIEDGIAQIGDYAFGECSNLAQVTIPNSVTSIGAWAFLGTALKSITIPDSVKTIGEGAFRNCENLESISIPKQVTKLEDELFMQCRNLSDVTIPDGVISIGVNVFAYCRKLENITIPEGVLQIGGGAFDTCQNLTSITFPNSLKSIGHYAFANCTNLVYVHIPTNVTEMGTGVFNGCTNLAYVHIPASVNSIDRYIFDRCLALTYICSDTADCYAKTYAEANGIEFRVCDGHGEGEILSGNCGKDGDNVTWTLDTGTGKLTISGLGEMERYHTGTTPWYAYRTKVHSVAVENGVTGIGQCAFQNCSELKLISIPESVVAIGDFAFNDCKGLTAILVNEQNTAYCSDACGTLFNESKTMLIQYPVGNLQTAYSIPDSVTSICDYAFAYCPNLMNVTIPDSVTRIGSYAFCGCVNLTSATIPNGVTSIEEGVFGWCFNLQNISIPDSVTEIGYLAFNECNSLVSISMPGVTHIGWCAFWACRCLESIVISDSATYIGDLAFEVCDSLPWIHIPESVTEIGEDAFSMVGPDFYICSDSADCYAKTYAEANGIEFRVCAGHTQRTPGDADGDGMVTLKDAALISRYLAGGWGVVLH